jgi:membrane-associated protease RseP (regulator of RpoE activity)
MRPSSRFNLGLPRLAALALCLPLGAGAQEPPAPDLDLVDEAVLTVASQHAGEDGEPIRIERPARVRYELGAVVDARPDDGGLPRVMAVTPGRAAARMGLVAGDRLLGINGAALNAGDDAGALLRTAVEGGQGILRLAVQRGAERRELSGHVDRVAIPGYRLEITPTAPAEGCGRVSVFLKPPVSQRLFPALLHEIDGRLPGPLSNTVFRVSPGRHVLKVSELIDGNRFDALQNRRRGQLMRQERFKFLEIEVQPNTTYRLGVRFDPERIDPVRDQAYWEPVIWQEVAEPCR